MSLVAASCARSGLVPWPCDGQTCAGHGTCGVTQSGAPLCACDPGFRNAGPLTCEQDPYSANAPTIDATVLDGGGEDRPAHEGGADARGGDGATLQDAPSTDRAAPRDAGADDRAAPRDAGADDRAAPLDAGASDRSAPLDASAGDGVAPRDAASADRAAPTPDASAAADCRLFNPVPLPAEARSDAVNDFWGAAPEDLRAVTAAGRILRWDGCTMRTEHQVEISLQAIWGETADDVWAAGTGDFVLRWNGLAWSALLKPATSNIRDVWGSSPDDLWFVGSLTASDDVYVARWSSARGFTEPRLRNISVVPNAVWGSGPGDVWIAGIYGIIRSDGSSFDEFEYNYDTDYMYYAFGTTYSSIWGYGASDIDLGGRSWSWSQGSGSSYKLGTRRWNGTDFTWDSRDGNGYVYTHGSSPSERWRVGAMGYVQRDQGGGWKDVAECGAPPQVVFDAVYVFSPDDVWFAAANGGVFHYCAGASRDADRDGYDAAVCGGDDCDDCVEAIHPGILESPAAGPVCADGLDNDCDGKIDSADEGCQ